MSIFAARFPPLLLLLEQVDVRLLEDQAALVTHDQSEAMALSDNIIIMSKGVVEQMGSPQEIYYHPKNEFVADFIGEANFLPGEYIGKPGKTIVLRPESATLADEGGIPCKVILSAFMGSYQNYHVRVGDTLVKITDNCPVNKKIYNVGDSAYISFDASCAHLL